MASNFLQKYVTKSPDHAMVTTEVDKIEMKSRIYILVLLRYRNKYRNKRYRHLFLRSLEIENHYYF